MAVFPVSKSLNRVFRYSREQCQLEGFAVHVNGCVVCVIQNELLELLISLCELILMLLL